MKVLVKIFVCWMANAAAVILAGALIAGLHLKPVQIPSNASPLALFLSQLAGSAILVCGMVPLARGLAGSSRQRSAVFAAFLYTAVGINGVIETVFFTHFADGRLPAVTIFYVVQCLLLGVAMGTLFGSRQAAPGLLHHTLLGWVARAAMVWLAWPLIYLTFGMCVAPFVNSYYIAGIAGLQLPSLSTIVLVQLVRGPIFLAGSLPFLALWRGSRRNLWLALGLAHAAVVGLSGLVSATFFPTALRIAHSLEITGDSFAFAGLLVLLFTVPAVRTQPAPALGQPAPRVL